jgi:uncharacterized membrane-anchored protein YhcB (DUF1043 family)
MTYLIISFILGFVVGALVFRNNKTKAEAFIQKAQQEAKDAADKFKK